MTLGRSTRDAPERSVTDALTDAAAGHAPPTWTAREPMRVRLLAAGAYGAVVVLQLVRTSELAVLGDDRATARLWRGIAVVGDLGLSIALLLVLVVGCPRPEPGPQPVASAAWTTT